MIHFVGMRKATEWASFVVEGIKAGQELNGWVMEDDKGHPGRGEKVTSRSAQGGSQGYKPGDTVIKYGVDIGKVVAPIAKGEPRNVQNIKTKRW